MEELRAHGAISNASAQLRAPAESCAVCRVVLRMGEFPFADSTVCILCIKLCVCACTCTIEETTSFDAFWGPINKELGFMNMEIRRVRYPYNKENYMGVVNKVRSERKQRTAPSPR